MRRYDVLSNIDDECLRQTEKWGEQSHFDHVWLSILLEEIGEAAKNINEGKSKSEIDFELNQCAAVLVSWLADDNRKDEVSE